MRTSSFIWLLLLAGCPDRPIGSVDPVQVKSETMTLPASPNRDVDILFVVDNSGSMEQEQASLRANFGKFMDVLSTIEGGIPNLHIGVVTSNLGQRAGDGVGTNSLGAACAGSGDDGVMRTAPAVDGRFLIDEEAPGGARTRNYSGTLASAFAELADVGTDGCGIEQHLAASQRALTHPSNAGFVRDTAKLAVIFIADEDDCSLDHKALFDGTVSGAEINFRCTREGIECDGGSLDTPGVRTSCQPRIDSPYLGEIDSYVDFLARLKPAAEKNVIVAGIVGDPDAVRIDKEGPQSVLAPSCTYGGQYAYPAVRTASFLDRFPQSVRQTICEGDLSGALVQIGALLKRSFGDPCFTSEIADLDPAPGLQPDCTASDYRTLPDGSEQEVRMIPSCAFGQIPCWRIEEDAQQCHYTRTRLKLAIDRGGELPGADMFVKATCATSAGATP